MFIPYFSTKIYFSTWFTLVSRQSDKTSKLSVTNSEPCLGFIMCYNTLKKRRFLTYMLVQYYQIFSYFIRTYSLRPVTRTLISECVERYFWEKGNVSLGVNIFKLFVIKKLFLYFVKPFFFRESMRKFFAFCPSD